MSINLSISLGVPAGVSTNSISYARIDNLAPGISPVFTNAGDFNTFPATIATNIPAGQYQIQATPIYPDLRSCAPTVQTTPGCPGLVSITASLNNNVIVVNYVAPSTAPKVRITINYPNGGSSVANYVNDGNPVSVGIPVGVFGAYSIFGQSVCDESSGFFSPPSSTVTLNYAQTISGTFLFGTTSGSACSATPTTVYTSGSFIPGGQLFLDSALSSPVTGFLYAITGGVIYNINSTTGVLGNDSGLSCTGSSQVVVFNNTTSEIILAVNGINGYSLPGSLGPGQDNFGTHTPFTGAITVQVGAGAGATLCLYKNSVILNSVITAGAGTYGFPSTTFLSNDSLTIIWSLTGC